MLYPTELWADEEEKQQPQRAKGDVLITPEMMPYICWNITLDRAGDQSNASSKQAAEKKRASV